MTNRTPLALAHRNRSAPSRTSPARRSYSVDAADPCDDRSRRSPCRRAGARRAPGGRWHGQPNGFRPRRTSPGSTDRESGPPMGAQSTGPGRGPQGDSTIPARTRTGRRRPTFAPGGGPPRPREGSSRSRCRARSRPRAPSCEASRDVRSGRPPLPPFPPPPGRSAGRSAVVAGSARDAGACRFGLRSSRARIWPPRRCDCRRGARPSSARSESSHAPAGAGQSASTFAPPSRWTEESR